MIDILDLTKERVLVCDGAMGTELHRRGLTGSDCVELWNVERPAIVEDVHRSYRAAGAQVILTNTFGGTRFKLEKRGLANRCEELNRAAAQLAVRAAGVDAIAVGDVGPTGEMLKPYGTTEPSDVRDAFAQQIRALVAGGVGAIVVESMISLDEALEGLAAAKEVCSLPVIVSLTLQEVKDGYRTMMGEAPGQCASALVDAGADVVGANCGTGLTVADYAVIVAEIAGAVDVPIIVEPNAGMPRLVGDATVFDKTPESWTPDIPALIDAGARIIGGCCGTTPDHIAMLRKMIDDRNGE